ncbi:unnamed protein product [Euphydryas editha]|uniref:Reverse transcriptase n=1 Tax=Euphydryas editha TaxID=104508 RepID=A0AAU9TUB9_EUPED|nr:unnamed protein product [Euphydryas editha]
MRCFYTTFKNHTHRPAYRWTPEISVLRERCHELRRRVKRTAKHSSYLATYSSEYKKPKKHLNQTIKVSKATLWKEICNDLDKDIWGKAYQIVVKKHGKAIPEVLKPPSIMNNVVAELFLKHPPREKRNYTNSGEVSPFTVKELQNAARTLKSGKAPGPDGIPTVIKIIAQDFPDLLLNVYNACLATGTFAIVWKRQRLVLLDKGKGIPLIPSFFRPLYS